MTGRASRKGAKTQRSGQARPPPPASFAAKPARLLHGRYVTNNKHSTFATDGYQEHNTTGRVILCHTMFA
jgi:hypothetical protein